MNPGILIGAAGFLAGSVGLKAVTSDTARRLYVKGLVQGMKVKDTCESLVEEAKAEFDDLMAEAEYEAGGVDYEADEALDDQE